MTMLNGGGVASTKPGTADSAIGDSSSADRAGIEALLQRRPLEEPGAPA